MIGEVDNTNIAKDTAPVELKPKLGIYAKFGPATVKALPNAPLITFADLGHSSHIQDHARIHLQLIKQLQTK